MENVTYSRYITIDQAKRELKIKNAMSLNNWRRAGKVRVVYDNETSAFLYNEDDARILVSKSTMAKEPSSNMVNIRTLAEKYGASIQTIHYLISCHDIPKQHEGSTRSIYIDEKLFEAYVRTKFNDKQLQSINMEPAREEVKRRFSRIKEQLETEIQKESSNIMSNESRWKDYTQYILALVPLFLAAFIDHAYLSIYGFAFSVVVFYCVCKAIYKILGNLFNF